MSENKTQIDLSSPIRDENNNLIYLVNEIYQLPQYEGMTANEYNAAIRELSPKQIHKLSPALTFGRPVKAILSSNISIENNNELSMELYKFIERINNNDR